LSLRIVMSFQPGRLELFIRAFMVDQGRVSSLDSQIIDISF
jgi:hypothetical protein